MSTSLHMSDAVLHLRFTVPQCLSHLSDGLAHVLYHHLVRCYMLQSKQAPVVDVAAAETDPLLAELKQSDGF